MRRFFLALTLVFCLVGVALSKDNPERTQVARAIHIQAGENTGDITCFGCSIFIRGQVNGDATAFGGTVVIEQGGSVSGDATAFGGDIRLQAGASVSGDATTFGGYVRRDPRGTVGGDLSSFGGFAWLLVISVPPLLVLAGVIALIVWLVSRNRPRPAPVYTSAPTMRV